MLYKKLRGKQRRKKQLTPRNSNGVQPITAKYETTDRSGRHRHQRGKFETVRIDTTDMGG